MDYVITEKILFTDEYGTDVQVYVDTAGDIRFDKGETGGTILVLNPTDALSLAIHLKQLVEA